MVAAYENRFRCDASQPKNKQGTVERLIQMLHGYTPHLLYKWCHCLHFFAFGCVRKGLFPGFAGAAKAKWPPAGGFQRRNPKLAQPAAVLHAGRVLGQSPVVADGVALL
jgi:hypothetical protein